MKVSHHPFGDKPKRSTMTIDAKQTLLDMTEVVIAYNTLIETLQDESDVDDAQVNGQGGWVANDAMRFLQDQDKGIEALKRLGWPKKGDS